MKAFLAFMGILLLGFEGYSQISDPQIGDKIQFADSISTARYQSAMHDIDSLISEKQEVSDSVRAALISKYELADSAVLSSIHRLQSVQDEYKLNQFSERFFGEELPINEWGNEFEAVRSKFMIPQLPTPPVLGSIVQLPSVEERIPDLPGMESIQQLPNLDSLSMDGLIESGGKKVEEYLANTEEMKYLADAKSQIDVPFSPGDMAFDQQRVNDMKSKMVNDAKLLVNKHAAKLQQMQQQANALKSKYSKIPNSDDLSTAVKQTSLEEEPFADRILFGGNFNITRTNPFSVDLSPNIGYRFNKMFHIGIGGLYRAGWKADSANFSIAQEADAVYGLTLYGAHMVYKNFFGYVEGQYLKTTYETENGTVGYWDEALLIGIGRNFVVTRKFGVQVMLLYNVLHNKNGLYDRPIQVKTGITFHK